MRMWGIDPALMCRQHLLGEHMEMHMFVGTIEKGRSLDGYIRNKLVNIGRIWERHDELALEMKSRGMNHNSELPRPDTVPTGGSIDLKANMLELKNRCAGCRSFINPHHVPDTHNLRVHINGRWHSGIKVEHQLSTMATRLTMLAQGLTTDAYLATDGESRWLLHVDRTVVRGEQMQVYFRPERLLVSTFEQAVTFGYAEVQHE